MKTNYTRALRVKELIKLIKFSLLKESAFTVMFGKIPMIWLDLILDLICLAVFLS